MPKNFFEMTIFSPKFFTFGRTFLNFSIIQNLERQRRLATVL